MEAKVTRLLGREGHERLAGVTLRPPGTRRQHRVFRYFLGVGNTAIPTQHPCPFRRYGQLADIRAVERNDAAAQHWRADNLALRRSLLQKAGELVDLR
ncbi:hypothetical protein NZA98_03710, partial [Escherichia coli]|nr:hypothetical protein [Escherichia coli]